MIVRHLLILEILIRSFLDSMSQLSDTSTAVDWSPLHGGSRPLSSQSSQISTNTPFEALKTDRLQSALSSSWSSYLSTQHTSRELSSLKRSFDEQVKQINGSLARVQHDLQDHEKLVSNTAAESTARSEQINSELLQLRPAKDGFSLLQHEVRSNREQTAMSISDLNSKVGALQEQVEVMSMRISQDLATAQSQYGSALDTIEFLQGEIGKLRAEREVSETKLSALERRVGEMAGNRRELSQETVDFLDQIMSQRSELERLMRGTDSQPKAAPVPSNNNSSNGNEGSEALPCE